MHTQKCSDKAKQPGCSSHIAKTKQPLLTETTFIISSIRQSPSARLHAMNRNFKTDEKHSAHLLVNSSVCLCGCLFSSAPPPPCTFKPSSCSVWEIVDARFASFGARRDSSLFSSYVSKQQRRRTDPPTPSAGASLAQPLSEHGSALSP